MTLQVSDFLLQRLSAWASSVFWVSSVFMAIPVMALTAFLEASNAIGHPPAEELSSRAEEEPSYGKYERGDLLGVFLWQ